MKNEQIFTMMLLLSLIAYKVIGADSNDFKSQVVAGNTEFAFNLYSKLKGDSNTPGENLFFSPYSISTALAMTYGGARGETQKQMAEVLHFTLPNELLHRTFGDIQKDLVQKDNSRGCQLLLANALWGQKGEMFLKKFLDLAESYGAGLRQLDFVKETEPSRRIINLWVDEKTNNKINNIIPPGGVDENTKLVLTNAIYFKGDWRIKFEKEETCKADFFVSEKNKVQVDMMHIKEKFKYYTDDKMKVLELPYKGNKLSMLIFLPNEMKGIKEVENSFSVESINSLTSKMQSMEMDVYFPKFRITWGTFSLKNPLMKMGMKDAFENADFSGITGKKNLWISDVFHQAFVEVNEEGTEAAAATVVVMTLSLDLDKIFHADHPFLFIIKDNQTGSILFMGRVMNPSE